MDSKALSTMTVEPKVQLTTRFLSRGKEIEDDIDLDEKIEISKWDFDNITADQMHIASQLLQKKA